MSPAAHCGGHAERVVARLIDEGPGDKDDLGLIPATQGRVAVVEAVLTRGEAVGRVRRGHRVALGDPVDGDDDGRIGRELSRCEHDLLRVAAVVGNRIDAPDAAPVRHGPQLNRRRRVLSVRQVVVQRRRDHVADVAVRQVTHRPHRRRCAVKAERHDV